MEPVTPEPPVTRWESEIVGARWQDYVGRFAKMYDEGADLEGEARFADAMAPRQATILDAGCGVGRLAAGLAARGHFAIGVDKDPGLLEQARRRHPETTFVESDLLTLSAELLAAHGFPGAFDIIVVAGNVMVFLAPGTERAVLQNLRGLLKPDGRLVTGFATDRDYPLSAFDLDLVAAGFRLEQRFATWHLDPWTEESSWATSVLRAADGRGEVPGDDERWA